MTDDNDQADEVRHLTEVGVEHMLGMEHGPLVKFQVGDGQGLTLLGQLDPGAARRIAGHLMEAAARAEYEADLFATMVAAGWERQHIGVILRMVRDGEENRLTKKEQIHG